MTPKDAYYFGNLVRQVDFYAYPRTGSHFFLYAMSGLFDLVAFAHPELHNPEAVARQRELREEVMYALDLREDGAPHAPVYFNALRNGVHGRPSKGADPMVVLIRDPLAVAYSAFRVQRDRWRVLDPAAPAPDPLWVEATLRDYVDFYRDIVTPEDARPADVLVVRYERLVESHAPLADVVRLVGLRPKLRPEFVFWLVNFQNMVKPGDRTFYRAGRNDAWREDPDWISSLSRVPDDIDFTHLGYPSLHQYLAAPAATP